MSAEADPSEKRDLLNNLLQALRYFIDDRESLNSIGKFPNVYDAMKALQLVVPTTETEDLTSNWLELLVPMKQYQRLNESITKRGHPLMEEDIREDHLLTKAIFNAAKLMRREAESLKKQWTATDDKSDAGTPIPDAYAELRAFAHANLKGQERAVIEALCDAGGELPIADLAVKHGVDWDNPFQGYRNAQTRLKSRLKRCGWTLVRQSNAAWLMRTSVESVSN